MNDRQDCSILKLISIVERLRGPDGCPWDKAQTTDSLKPYLLEECHEYLCALEQANNEEIQDELGDLLLQIVLHAQIFNEKGIFVLCYYIFFSINPINCAGPFSCWERFSKTVTCRRH